LQNKPIQGVAEQSQPSQASLLSQMNLRQRCYALSVFTYG